MRKLLCLLVFVPSIASAQVVVGSNPDDAISVLYNGSAFTDIDIHSGVTTDAIRTEGYRFLTFSLVYSWSAATAVTMTCLHGEETTTIDFYIPALSYTGSTAASDVHTWSNAVSASESWSWTVNLNAYRYVTCTFTATGGDASDTLTIIAKAGSH